MAAALLFGARISSFPTDDSLGEPSAMLSGEPL